MQAVVQPIIVHTRRLLDARGRVRVQEVVLCPAKHRLRVGAGGATEPRDVVESCEICGKGGGAVFDERFDSDGVDSDDAPLSKTRLFPRAVIEEGSLDWLHEITVGDICTRDVVCAEPETPIGALHDAFVEHAVGAIPVLEPTGKPIGIVSPVDLLLPRKGLSAAQDCMSRDPVLAESEMPATRAAGIMAYEGIHHLLVQEHEGDLGGILSSVDVLRVLAQRCGALVPRRTSRQRG